MQRRPRPLSVTLVGWLYIVTGAFGFVMQAGAFKLSPLPYDTIFIELIRLLALVSGVFLLAGRNWARWLALAWIAFHAVVSAFHRLPEFVMHCAICALVAYLLYRPHSTRYFRDTRA